MRLTVQAFVVGAALALGSTAALAQGYPNRPVRLIVPFAPGGFTDVVARVIATGLGASLGQALVIENRPGAGSTLGADIVAKSPPDGYKLLMISTTHVISESLYKKLPYDSLKSFTPVAKIAEAPYVLVVNSKVPANDVAGLVALAKADPGKVNYASSGNGSSQHLMAALFASMTGIQVSHVPYRGSGQAANDLAAGVVSFGFMGTPVAIQQTQAGRTRALAVTSAKRSPQLPNVPSLAEAGLAGYDASVWLGLLAPAGSAPREGFAHRPYFLCGWSRCACRLPPVSTCSGTLSTTLAGLPVSWMRIAMRSDEPGSPASISVNWTVNPAALL